ncbi:MAG: GNAT family N-acetyltransferase [Brevundimonas sp.]|uniref:GNAT family N-acetyltransferase n=1 Tax=Brevundimonas sp. TaxID=1871086 RepID=UPI00391B5EDB
MTDVRIETERLILRPVEMADFPRWAEFMADEESARFLGGGQKPAAAWRGFMSMAGAWHLTGVSMFSVVEKSSGLWVGRLGPWTPLDWPGTEVGWGLHRDAWGKGYAVEGASAAIDYAFDVLGWDDVIHCIDPDNRPSQKVAERLGSTNRGAGRMPAPYEDHPVDIWGQDRATWKARR